MGNWFVALPVEAELPLPAPPEGLRLFAPADRHVTVAFLGPVSEDAARAAFAAVARVVGDGRFTVPAAVGLGAVVPLGPARRWSALAALLGEGRAEVEAAMATVRREAWRAARAEADDRPPLAHVTLARPPRTGAHVREAALAWAAGLDLRGVSIPLRRVALYGWAPREAADGRRFAEVEVAPLG